MHGVGKAVMYDFRTGREVLRILKHESATWTFSYEDVDVMGGDDLDIYETFETSRAQSVTFNETRFDVRQLEPVTGKRAVEQLNVPIVQLDEGFNIPDAPGPYTHTLAFATSAEDDTIRIRFGSDWEDMAPVPTNFSDAGNVAEDGTGATFALGDAIDIRITAVLTSGIESVATTVFTHTMVANGDLIVTVPETVLTTPTGMPAYDVNELEGFNIYIDVNAAGEALDNGATPVPAGTAYTLLDTGAAAIPDAVPTVSGQYTVSSGVITFAAADASKEALVDYIWRTSSTTPEATVVDILKNCLRNFVRCIWRVDFRAQDGSTKGMEVDIYKMKYTGDYTIELSRDAASTHSMEFKILDPERADKKLLSVKIVNLAEVTGCD